MKEEKLSMINDSACYDSDEHTDTMSYSSKQVDASNTPITDTHIFNRVRNLSVGIVSVEPAVIWVGIIGRGITQGVISRLTSIVKNIVTDIFPDSSKRLFETNTFQLNLPQSETLVIGSQDESMKSTNRIIVETLGGGVSVVLTPQELKKMFGV